MDSELKKKCCMNCKYGGLFVKCEKLKALPEYAELCNDKIQSSETWIEKDTKKIKIKNNFCCDDFKNSWLEYPITVKDIVVNQIKYNEGFSCKMGSLVKIRPCGEEYKNKTYLGFYIGDLPTQIYQSYKPNTNTLTITNDSNPAIFVPELQKIIFGYESWWGKIKNED